MPYRAPPLEPHLFEKPPAILLGQHDRNRLIKYATNQLIQPYDDLIKAIRERAPQAFHDKNSLISRRFFHKPASSIPMAGYVVYENPDKRF